MKQSYSNASNNGRKSKPPIITRRDGAVAGKLWENTSRDGKTYIVATFGKTVTDPETGEAKEIQSYYGTDILKLHMITRDLYDMQREYLSSKAEAKATAKQESEPTHETYEHYP